MSFMPSYQAAACTQRDLTVTHSLLSEAARVLCMGGLMFLAAACVVLADDGDDE